MLRDEELISAERIKDELLGKGSKERENKMIVEIFDDHNQKVAIAIPDGIRGLDHGPPITGV